MIKDRSIKTNLVGAIGRVADVLFWVGVGVIVTFLTYQAMR